MLHPVVKPAYAEASGGCWITESQESAFVSLETNPQFFLDGSEKMYGGSGNAKLDYALAHTLADLTKVFGILPAFTYFTEPDGTRNAFATPSKEFDRADGTVKFGRSLLAELLRTSEAPDACVISVCAHEYAHILQYKKGLEPTFRNEKTVLRKELHADFLSGYYAGTRKLKRDSFPAQVFAFTQFHGGDDRKEAFANPRFHGTRRQRGDATLNGFRAAYYNRKSIDEAFQIGLHYVFDPRNAI